MKTPLVSKSKFLSLILRHEPQRIGLMLDAQGWADIEELLAKAVNHGPPLSREELFEIVATNEKRRFAISDDGIRIRANQGHSIEIELDLSPVEPPEILYHGTAERNLEAILKSGLLKMARQDVHLARDAATARQVGARHGKPMVLCVQAGAMWWKGLLFYLSVNGVWLTDAVPPEYLHATSVG